MLDFDTLADVRSAIHQIDLMIDDLLARRDHCLREAARFVAPAGELGAAEPPIPQATQAQCAPCSGSR